MNRRRGFAALSFTVPVLASIGFLGCGGRESRLIMECPSPDQKMNAVYWYSMGGGAAGWAYEYLTLVPNDAPAADIVGKDEIADGMVLTLSGGYNVSMTWRDDDTLLVDYPDSAGIRFSSPRGYLTPGIKVIYRGVPSTPEGMLAEGNQCNPKP